MSAPPETLRISPAARDDLDALMALEDASFTGDRISRRQYRHHLANPSAAVLAARDEDGLAGAALLLFRRDSRTARLYSLAVDAARRGRGVGRALLEACESLARERGCSRLRLEVRADNATARALYARQGYACDGERPGYYEDGATALCLGKTLPD